MTKKKENAKVVFFSGFDNIDFTDFVSSMFLLRFESFT